MADSLFEDGISENDIIIAQAPDHDWKCETLDDQIDDLNNDVKNPDSVIAKVMKNKVFLANKMRTKRNRRFPKV